MHIGCIVSAAHRAADGGCSPVDLRTLAEDRLDIGILLVSISIALPMQELGYISIVHRSPRTAYQKFVWKKRFDKYN